jgi:hypothetical protein
MFVYNYVVVVGNANLISYKLIYGYSYNILVA